MTESIGELRRICQEPKERSSYRMCWFEKNVTRKISIYLTKLFLKVGISANQATLINFLVIITSGAVLTLANPSYWLIGLLLACLSFVLDCTDGEIARYNKSASPIGAYLDYVLGLFTFPYILACMSFGIYNSLHSFAIFIFGFLAVICYLLNDVLELLSFYIFHEMKPQGKATKVAEVTEEPTLIRYGRVIFRILFNVPGLEFIPAALLVTVIDCFIAPFTINSLTFNARFAYLIAFGLAALAPIIEKVYNVFHSGVRL